MIQLDLKEDLVSSRPDIFPGRREGGGKRGGRDREGKEGSRKGSNLATVISYSVMIHS